MNNGIKFIFAFSVGAAVGSVAAWKLLKTKYEKIAQDEIDSMAEYYAELYAQPQADTESDEIKDEDLENAPWVRKSADVRSLATRTSELGYSNLSEKEVEDVGTPTVIAPEEFGTIEEYETVDLTYYADGVLTDDRDEVITDLENTVGKDFAKYFGEYEDDSVHIRNDIRKIDYEILAVTRNYSDIAE